MSVVELERAATAPFRWITLSHSKDRNEDGCLPSRRTRIIKDPITSIEGVLKLPRSQRGPTDLYLVPGGRYLVISGLCCLGIWDLGYVSDAEMSSDGKPTMIWATRVDKIKDFVTHPSPDGLSIRILTHSYVDSIVF